jgi:RNA polymerase-binding transcription factor DksA
MTADVLLGRSAGHAADSIVGVAAASLSPRAVLNAQWSAQLRRLTDLSIQLHDGEQGSPEVDQLALQATIDATRSEMEAIEAALERLSYRTYGNCETCGGPIDSLRLAGLPTAQTCRRCAQSAQRLQSAQSAQRLRSTQGTL